MLRVIGAGFPRTGTLSLKPALEELLGAPCYHGSEAAAHVEHMPTWLAAVHGQMPDWERFLTGYVATADWPAAAFWRPLSEAYPDALVLLSIRESAEAWWQSFDQTVLQLARNELPEHLRPFQQTLLDLLRTRMTPDWNDGAAMMAAYDRHNAEVRAVVPPERLLIWRPGEGWAPICKALGLAVPDRAFPAANSREEWAALLARFGVKIP
jgi:hypothetical protein